MSIRLAQGFNHFDRKLLRIIVVLHSLCRQEEVVLQDALECFGLALSVAKACYDQHNLQHYQRVMYELYLHVHHRLDLSKVYQLEE